MLQAPVSTHMASSPEISPSHPSNILAVGLVGVIDDFDRFTQFFCNGFFDCLCVRAGKTNRISSRNTGGQNDCVRTPLYHFGSSRYGPFTGTATACIKSDDFNLTSTFSNAHFFSA
jgi:hypothetical protein